MHLKACRVWRIRQAFFYPYPARHTPINRPLREEKGTLPQTVWVDFQYGNRGGWPMMYRDIHVARLDSFRYTGCFGLAETQRKCRGTSVPGVPRHSCREGRYFALFSMPGAQGRDATQVSWYECAKRTATFMSLGTVLCIIPHAVVRKAGTRHKCREGQYFALFSMPSA